MKDLVAKLDERGLKMSGRANIPFLFQAYRPKLDNTPLLSNSDTNWYQGLIGILRWCIELGHINIMLEVLLLSRFMATPRAGHLEQTIHVLLYLNKHLRSSLVMDDTKPELSALATFEEKDWREFYPNAKEPIPPNMPKPRDKPVTTTCFVDADHAGCRVTRRSQTGIIIFCN